MADPKFIPPESPPPELPGGRTRPSLLVAVEELPGVARRIDLNRRLLARTCPFGAPEEELLFSPDDLDLLLLTVQERFGAEAALLRHQAVVALGSVDSDEAVRRLVELVVSPVEHDNIRISALTVLPEHVAGELLDQLAEDPSAAVAAYVQRRRDGRTERPPVPAHVPLDPDTGQRECGCGDPCRCC